MKKLCISYFFTFTISLVLLVAPLPLFAMVQESIAESHDTYIYLGQDVSNIGGIIERINDLDDNDNSLLNDLHEYIKNGFLFGEYDAVLEALSYAQTVLQRNHDVTKRTIDTLHTDFESLMNKVYTGELTINDEDDVQLSDTMCWRKHSSGTTKIKKNLVVSGKTTLKKYLNAKQGVHIQGKLTVNKSAKFKKNVKIKGELSAGSLSVGEIIIGSCLDNLCVNNLSIVNESISGTLSVNNAVIQNGVIKNLTITSTIVDSMINNLTVLSTLSITNEVVQNLTVANCINNLCVNNLSVGNESISGTLSVNEVITETLSSCDVIVGCNIVMNNSISSAGNVLKGGNRFINNFGANNTFVGVNSGNFSMSGSGNNCGFGVNALTSNSTGAFNTAMGSNALTANTKGSNNIAIGSGALSENISGSGNVAIGLNTLAANISGSNNTAVGRDALSVNTTNGNTAVGFSALTGNTTGNNNTAVGNNTLATVTTGSTNIAIGDSAGGTLATGNNNIYIGLSAASGAESNHTRIAQIRGVTTDIADAIPVLIDSTGQLGTMSSTRKVKHNIEDMNDLSAHIYDLRPVTFVYNSDVSETTQYGLIAEEVDEIFPGIVVRDADGQPQTVQYHVLPVLLLNEMQKQYNELLMHKDLINQLERKASLFEQQAVTFAARLDALEAH